MVIAQRIKQLRKLLSLSQAEFGKRLGVSRDVINNLECSRVEPKEVFLDHLCLIYCVSGEWLYEGLGEIFKHDPKAEGEFKEAVDIFSSLSPKFKTYALNQMRGLLEVQNSSEDS